MAAHTPLIDEERYLRLQVAAKTLLPHSHQKSLRDELVQRAVTKLERRYNALVALDPPYAYTILRNLYRDWLRKKENRAAALASEPPAPPPKLDEPPPACVIERELQLVYAEGVEQPHKLLMDAYLKRLGWRPARVVDTLGALTLRQAADGFLADYERHIKPNRLHEVFANLLKLRELPDGGGKLRDYWDIAGVYREWIDSVRELVSAAGGEFSPKVLSQPPHRRLAYLLHDKLGQPVQEIIALDGEKYPPSVSAEFQREYAARHHTTEALVRHEFGAMLDCGSKPLLTFNRYASPAVRCTKWLDDVQTRLRTAKRHEEIRAHRMFFERVHFPHLSLTFLETSALNASAERTYSRFSEMRLSEWRTDFEERYAEKRRLSPDLVSECLAPLRSQIAESGDGKLKDYVRETLSERWWSSRWRTPAAALSGWRENVRIAVAGEFGRGHPQTIFFAWGTGLL